MTHLMMEFRLRQVEVQKGHDEQMLFIKDVFTKSVASIPQPVYVAPNQYGNREYPPLQGAYRTNLKGWYWDGKPHGRGSCENLKRAINRKEVHHKGKAMFVGQDGVGDSIRVPVPMEIVVR